MFRRSGSLATFFIDGQLPSPAGADFGAALARRRFRSIENAAAEQSSIGWVTPNDPSGDSFAAEDMRCGDHWWLRARIDKKTLPAAWVAIHRAAAERSAGRPLRAREKRELREGLERSLLPRVLPAVRFVDVLYAEESKLLLLFSTARGVQEEFAKLMRLTFEVHLEAATPHRLAQDVGLAADQRQRLDELSPVRWTRPRSSAIARPSTESLALEVDS